jgi:hypothetical protein
MNRPATRIATIAGTAGLLNTPTVEPLSLNLKLGRTAVKPPETSRACSCVIPAGFQKIVLASLDLAAEPA